MLIGTSDQLVLTSYVILDLFVSPVAMQTGATFCSETDVTWQGEVLSVHLADDGGARMSSPTMIKAIAGRGVQGDRYCLGRESGHFSHHKGARRQITLFESEVLDAALRDHNLTLAPDECRMNVVTRGVPLNHLVGRRFRVPPEVSAAGLAALQFANKVGWL